MTKTMAKNIFSLFFSFVFLFNHANATVAQEIKTKNMTEAKSAILMEQTTLSPLYEQNADEKVQIASVTKIMTMLLIMEALQSGKIKYTDMVETSEYAASMGGSQVFLEPGEQMSVDDMLKAICVSSGNDAAVAMAEFVGGSSEAFVEMMNRRAKELGAKNTHFINCNGLDETEEHYSTARDIALISCELLKHKDIQKYTKIWMDTIREGKFGLSNTNRLIRFYKGANGIKTGSTSAAKYCLSASAERDGMQLVVVVLGAPSTQERFGGATKLLDYGFANYAVFKGGEKEKSVNVKLCGGEEDFVPCRIAFGENLVVKKGEEKNIKTNITLEKELKAPVKKGTKAGMIRYTLGEKQIAEKEILTDCDAKRISYFKMYLRLLKSCV